MQLIHLFLTITATTAATVNSHLSQSRGTISALDFGHRNPSPELFTETHKVAGRADASDETHEVISWIGSDSESDDPKDLARGLIDNAFDALIKACSLLPFHGHNTALILEKVRDNIHRDISAYPRAHLVERKAGRQSISTIGGIDENSKLGETLVQIVKLECECVSVTGYLGTHLVRALGDIALKATEGLVGGGIEDSLDGLRNQFRNKMTAVAEELFVPEANCGTDASTTADEIDIGNIGENENSTIEDVLGSLSTDGCRCLSSTLYLAIHLLRAYFEVKLDILAAILGGSLHPLANLLDDLKDLLHQVLFAAGEIIRPDNISEFYLNTPAPFPLVLNLGNGENPQLTSDKITAQSQLFAPIVDPAVKILPRTFLNVATLRGLLWAKKPTSSVQYSRISDNVTPFIKLL